MTKNVHLVSSISFGARDDVDKLTIQSFTNTGVIHVLAVSGMNVALIFVVLDFLFRFLKSGRAGYCCYTVIILSGIWGYALITGMSASILRATMMFTFVIIGNVLQRNSNIFNSLAVSAFFLIILEPAIIRDVGFQLSYAAVLSIVVIQPFLYRLLYFKNRLCDQIWLLLSVTFAAQIGTLPFTLHYFHQFPVYFWMANLVVIPLVTLILYLSFVVVFLAFFSLVFSSVFALLLDWSVRMVLLTVNSVENLPHAVLKGLYPSLFQIAMVLLITYLFYRFYKNGKMVFLRRMILAVILLTLTAGIGTFRQLTRAEIVFFNIPGTRVLALTSGREAIVLYDHCEKAIEKLDYYLKPYLGERGIRRIEMFGLSDSLRMKGRNICVIGNFIFFRGIRLFVEPANNVAENKADPALYPDLVWLRDIGAGKLDFSSIHPSGTILYRASDEVENEINAHYPRRGLNVRKAILLTSTSTIYGMKNKNSCDYFNQRE